MAKRLQVILGDSEYREIQGMARSRQMSARRPEPLAEVGKKLEVIRAAAHRAYPVPSDN